jgi:hypothetical protein
MAHRNFHRGIENDIRREKRSIICVAGDDDSLPFAYTIGNLLAGLPELLMIGLTQTGAGILNVLSSKMIDRGHGFADGECVNLGGKFPVKIIIADQRAQRDYTIQASEHFGSDDYAVQQVLTPDRNGRFPDDPECQHPYSTIPILRGSAH